MMASLTIALTKGRILKETLPLLAAAGLEPIEDIYSSRKLVFETNHKDVELVVLRGADVTTYVRHGVADLGVAGKDMLLEHGSDGLYELLDLGIARCRLMTAAPVRKDASEAGKENSGQRISVASKFTNIARKHYAERGLNADIIQLYGALELAPIVGLADEIVDVVDTGNTLKANGLEPRELIAEISSRLIANKAALKTKYEQIQAWQERLATAVEQLASDKAGSE
ncbi:MAG: ATP phosphoribosyltransferase [Pseudomonadales bacterium]